MTETHKYHGVYGTTSQRSKAQHNPRQLSWIKSDMLPCLTHIGCVQLHSGHSLNTSFIKKKESGRV